MPVLSILIVLPLIGAVVVALLPKRRSELVYPIALGMAIPPLVVALYILWTFESGDGGFQFAESVVFSETFGVSWSVAVDGISLFMIILAALLFPLSIAASRSITDRAKTFMVLMLILESGVFGAFLALDLLLFFAFFEIVLIPMYLLISIWGSENRAYASLKFVLFTAFGSAFLLASIIALGIITGDQMGTLANFDFRNMLQVELSSTTQMLLFLGFGIAFAVKIPLFPFHTWLPDAHTEAPTAGSVILASVLLKMGAYGFLRFNLTLFPEASVSLAVPLAVLAVIGVVYGAAIAIFQPDVKRLIAYSSVSHMGFVVLGIFALTTQGLSGSIVLMISHGLTTGALFLLIGMIYERTHTRKIADYGGLAKVMPVYAGLFLFAVFASAALPGLSGFIGEFTVLIGSYLTLPLLTIAASAGVILAAIYLLWAYERIFTGPVVNSKLEALKDVSFREVAIMVPLVLLIVGLGVYPKPVFDRVEPSVGIILDRIEEATDFVVPDFGQPSGVVRVDYDSENNEGEG